MGARPTALLVALAVPKDRRLSFIAALADGFRDACAALAPGCAVVGGDLDRVDDADDRGDGSGRPGGSRPGHALRGADRRRCRDRGGDGLGGARPLGPVPAIPSGRLRRCRSFRLGSEEGEAEAIAAQLRPAPPIGSVRSPRSRGCDGDDGRLRRARAGRRAAGRSLRCDARSGPRRSRRTSAPCPRGWRGPRPARDVPPGGAARRASVAIGSVVPPFRTRPSRATATRSARSAGTRTATPARTPADVAHSARLRPPEHGVAVGALADEREPAAARSVGVERRARSITTTASGESRGAQSGEIRRHLRVRQVVRRIREHEIERPCGAAPGTSWTALSCDRRYSARRRRRAP